MGRSLSSLFRSASLLLERNTALVLLVELPLADAAGFPSGQVVRLARADRHIVADGLVYQAAPVKIVLPPEEGQGRLGSASLAIGNASRIPGSFVENGRVLGQTVTIRIGILDAPGSQAATTDPAASVVCSIVRATVSAGLCTLEMGHPSAGKRTPGPLFTRSAFPGLLPVGGGA